ncbi:MAG: aminotransferase class V-fold PLP-dependent enzyme [Candidatus Anstonellales archaeon]
MDVKKIREDFPILKEVIYFDNGATSQKPISVINAVSNFYKETNANVHRGLHRLSEKATLLYEKSKEEVASFIRAEKNEIIYTRNATEGFNLLMYSWGMENVKEGDDIVISIAEHHSNMLPWRTLAEKKGATLKYIDVDEEGNFNKRDIEKISRKTKILALTMQSNVIGKKSNFHDFVKAGKESGAFVVLDGAQYVPHHKLDVRKTEADAIAFTGHKMLAETGIGVLWVKKEWLEKMGPFMYGGDMIKEASLSRVTWNELPYKFEAGTPHISGAISIGEAVKYLKAIGMENIEEHEKKLASKLVGAIEGAGLDIIGGKDKECLASFTSEKIHPHDLAALLSEYNIAVRSGFHCAQPLHERYGKKNGSTRASLYFYNTEEEVKVFGERLQETMGML